MTEQTKDKGAAAAAPQDDPLAIFETTKEETSGVWVDVEHPNTGEKLMSFKLARFGGSNNTAIIREERLLKAKLPQGQRRAIDNNVGDPDIVSRLNRQVFVRVSVLDFQMHRDDLKARYPAFSKEVADEIFEAYPRIYDLVSEQAIDEANYAKDRLVDQSGN